MHQSAPNFATSRGAKLFTEEIEKATGGELKVRLHLSGTLQISASNITQAVGENVVADRRRSLQLRQHPGRRHPAPADADPVRRGFRQGRRGAQALYREVVRQKGSTVLASYTYPLQFMWGRKARVARRHQSMKFRVAQPEQGEFVRRFGGTSITMSAPEVPSRSTAAWSTASYRRRRRGAAKDLLKYGYVLIVNVNIPISSPTPTPTRSSRPICKASCARGRGRGALKSKYDEEGGGDLVQGSALRAILSPMRSRTSNSARSTP